MTNMTIVPDLRLGIFISTNTSTGRVLTQRFAARVVEQVGQNSTAWPRPAAPGLYADRALYEGRYLGTRRAYSGLEGMLARLNGGLTVQVTPEGRLVTREGGRSQTWVPEGSPKSGLFISDTGYERRVFKIEGNRARDARVVNQLHQLGWHVVTLWACAVKTRGARDWLEARLPVLIEGKPGKAVAKVAED